MTLTLEQINTFIEKPKDELRIILDDLVEKGYLKFEHPKKLVKEETKDGIKSYREYSYNFV